MGNFLYVAYCEVKYVTWYSENNYLWNCYTNATITNGAETAYSSGVPKFTPVLVGFVLLDL